MDHERLETVLSCPRLSSLPTIAVEVIEMARQPDSNIKHIAKTITNDPALSSKILKTVNSSFYSLSKPVSTISHAMVILGLNSVRTLALGFSLLGNLRGSDDDYDMVKFWQRSIYSAVAARDISQRAGIVDQEEAFLAGLLQDMGVMAMVQTLGKEYIDLFVEAGDDHAELSRLEKGHLNLGHAQVGAALAEQWRLPDVLVDPIRFHEQPQKAPPASQTMAIAVALGAQAADLFVSEEQPDPGAFFDRALELLQIDQPTCEQMLQQVSEDTNEMGRLFDISTDTVRAAGDILADANETLLQLSLETAQSADALEQQNQDLQEQVIRDQLTGAANRGHFTEFVRDQFEQVSQSGAPLSLVFMDADRFKSVNDTHGHQAGDQVLIALSKIMHELIPEGGLVARYGGEEFTMVLPGTDRCDAARFADSVRAEIERTPVQAGEDLTLNVTVSMGVATYEGQGVFAKPAQLIKAADRAVYAAKASGRNCVRIFTPKAAAAAS
ncbi:MAG: hypothetical protein CMJ49_10570 [Planctomycetaceae bacterium]|nr:hypothetical protein [Planctomycetaceae bacterium]